MPSRTTKPSGDGPASTRAFDHVLVIMFENQYRGYVLGNPYMRRLARPGTSFPAEPSRRLFDEVDRGALR